MHGDPMRAEVKSIEVRKLKRRSSLLGWTGLLRKAVPSKKESHKNNNNGGGAVAEDLVRESAHNLTRMRHASGAHELARALTRSFNTV